MAISKNTLRKTGHHACLREMTEQTYPIYALFANFHAPHFMIYFLAAGSKGFESKNLKKT